MERKQNLCEKLKDTQTLMEAYLKLDANRKQLAIAAVYGMALASDHKEEKEVN